MLEELVFVIKAPLAAQLSQLLQFLSASVWHGGEARGDGYGQDLLELSDTCVGAILGKLWLKAIWCQ